MIEVGLAKPKTIDCKHNGEYLASKLGELLSSMYLIGVLSSLSTELTNVNELALYGWLIFQGAFSYGISLTLNKDGCHVEVLSSYVCMHAYTHTHKCTDMVLEWLSV